MIREFPLHRFREFGDLSSGELESVKALGDTPRRYDRYETIRREGVASTGFFLLLDGWASASITLPGGGRQILKVHLPGDVMGSPSMCLTRTAEALTTITPALISAVPYERFGKLLVEHPRIGTYFLLSVQRERIALMDQLTSNGRTRAESRVAALLLDLLERLEPLGLVRGDRFAMCLTQEQIGDVLGLTGVHVNRTVRSLERRGLVARDRQYLTIVDRAALIDLAGRPPRELRGALTWLPSARDPA